MDDGGRSFGGLRIVVLSRDPSLAAALEGRLDSRMRCLRAGSPYEAAAEILAEPTAAMVIDLRTLSERHCRLLDIGRQTQLEMLAVGALPSRMSSEELSGVRLVSREALPEMLCQATARSGAALPATDSGAARSAPVNLTPAKRPGRQTKVDERRREDAEMYEVFTDISADIPPEAAGASAKQAAPAGARPSAEQAPAPTPAAAAGSGKPAPKRKTDMAAAVPQQPVEPQPEEVHDLSRPQTTEEQGPASGLLTPEEIAALLGEES